MKGLLSISRHLRIDLRIDFIMWRLKVEVGEDSNVCLCCCHCPIRTGLEDEKEDWNITVSILNLHNF